VLFPAFGNVSIARGVVAGRADVALSVG
jgi:hypothetical protein